jgi:hypothetical protein
VWKDCKIETMNQASKQRRSKVKEPIKLQVDELEERIAPAIVLTNPGGNEPQGSGAENGNAHDYLNPAGHAPGGWNK